jgi:soluble lytic murein transglycosylase-like protein
LSAALRNLAPIGALAAFTFSGAIAAYGADTNACEREMSRAAIRHQIPLSVLYAVGLTETGRSGSLMPYSLNIDGISVTAANLQDGIRQFEIARSEGAKLIDIGCMQINHHYHAMDFASLEDMFDPAKNVEYAAGFLNLLKTREGSWTMAVARYNAGPDNDQGQKKYICAVITNMVASGLGGWTDNALKFCGRRTGALQ